MGLVVCNLPKAGLGNQLFPLMKALVFGQLNNQEVIVSGYHQFMFGPYLRGEKSKRKYGGSFRFQKNILREWVHKRKIKGVGHYEPVTEPALEVLKLPQLENRLFFYGEIPSYNDYFSGLKKYRSLVVNLLMNQLKDSVKEKLGKLSPPVIGVHIRMGDFRKLNAGEDFRKAGQVRTPLGYFANVIKQIREIHGTLLPVTLFTDGYRNEVQEILALDSVNIQEGNPDIVDLLLLSRSNIIVASAGSTFSYWAGFLSDVPLILHPDHIYQAIRLQEKDKSLFEGPMDMQDPALINAIRKIC